MESFERFFALVIGVYAAISKELGVPLRFPGKPGAYHTLMEFTDASLLARATVWAATNPRTGADEYNIANGDLFRWDQMWPLIAKCFYIEVGDPLRVGKLWWHAPAAPAHAGRPRARGEPSSG